MSAGLLLSFPSASSLPFHCWMDLVLSAPHLPKFSICAGIRSALWRSKHEKTSRYETRQLPLPIITWPDSPLGQRSSPLSTCSSITKSLTDSFCCIPLLCRYGYCPTTQLVAVVRWMLAEPTFCISELQFETHWPGRQFSFPCQLIRVLLGHSCGGRFVFILWLTGSRLALGLFFVFPFWVFICLVWEVEPALLGLIVAPFTTLTSIVLRMIIGPQLRSRVLIL